MKSILCIALILTSCGCALRRGPTTEADMCVRYEMPDTLVRYYTLVPGNGLFYPGTRRGGQDIVWTNVPPLTASESLLERDASMGGRVHYLINLQPKTEPAPDALKRVRVPAPKNRKLPTSGPTVRATARP